MSSEIAEGLAREVTVAEPDRPGRLHRLRRARYQGERIEWVAYLFLLPYVVLAFLFVILPILAGVVVSLTEWKLLGDPKWIGLANFARIPDDVDIRMVYGNTLR